MLKKWAEDIRTKTKDMTGEQKAEYVITYYWYHILLTALFAGLVVLLIYHVGWGQKKKEFTLVMVNQEIDFARDREMEEEFSAFSGVNRKKILIDSDYLISYEDVKLEGVNESSYEKFFLNWSSGAIDAMIMPVSFLKYCESQGGKLADMDDFFDKEETAAPDASFYEEKGCAKGIYLENTSISEKLRCDSEDRIILVFPKEIKHEKICRKFLEYLDIGKGTGHETKIKY